jgi:beta-glucosidase
MMNEDNILPYQDPARTIPERARDLLNRMTIEEKLAQLGSAWLSELEDEPGVLSIEKAAKRIGKGLGTLTRPAGSTSYTPELVAKANNSLQVFLINQTRLGIPALVHEECLSGLMARRATAFPQIIGLASSWDPDLVEAVANVIGEQIKAIGGHQGLSPVLDVARDPRWGRIEETFGEDPYFVARMGTAYVRGLQGDTLARGVAATGKHFAAHGLPEGGLNWAPVLTGERELRQVYLHPFEAAIKEAGLAAVMSTYHELDGVPVTASRWLLEDVLRDEWGFEGVVVSDYNAVMMLVDYHQTAADKSEAACQALQAGVDFELPQTDCYGESLLKAINEGMISVNIVDAAVERVLRLKLRLGLFENPFVSEETVPDIFNRSRNTEFSLRAARESIVLLKNDAAILPLPREIHSIAVIGPNAFTLRRLLGDYSYASFAELMSGGATDPVVGGHLDASPSQFPESLPGKMETILEAIERTAGSGTIIRYAPGCGFSDLSRDGFDEALSAARLSDVAVLILGGKSGLTKDCTSGELRDRATLGLPGVQEELAQAVINTGTPVVIVLVDGRPAAIPALVEQAQAILEAWLPGEQGAQAVSDVLFGITNPGGKLPVTFPRHVGQVPIYCGHKPSGGQSYNFKDYVDMPASPLFPFGHGLSYTWFRYDNLVISSGHGSENLVGEAISIPIRESVNIQFEIQNCGERAGDEVVQLYIRDRVAQLTRPVKELKGFMRITLLPGEKRKITFSLLPELFAYYDLNMNTIVEAGEFEVMVGSSSEDIRLCGIFNLVGEKRIVGRKVFFAHSFVE